MPTNPTRNLATEPLRLCTWNLWFEDYLQIERLLAVLSYVEPLNPHILAFQELTAIADAFFSDANLPFSRIYQNVPFTLDDWQWYWEGIYSRLPFSDRSTRFAYEDSGMGRGLTVLHVPDLNLVVGCTHLESENEHALRRRQFARALELLESFGAPNKILMGDMNTRRGQQLNDLLPGGWLDAWETLQPDEPGFTRHPQRNVLAAGGEPQRLDRIYYCCRDFQPTSIRLVGEEALSVNGETFTPSDHFGVMLDLQPLNILS